MKSNKFPWAALRRAPQSILASALLLGAAAGCTHVMPVTVKSAALLSVPKTPVSIALVLDKDFVQYKHALHMMGDTFSSPLGPALQDYATNVTANQFAQVAVYASSAEAAGKADGILIPKVSKIDESYGLWKNSEHNMVMIIEWTLKDRLNQKDLWLDSIDARGHGHMGNSFTYKKQHLQLMQELFDDLSQKTQKAFEASTEFKKLSKPATP